MLRESAGGLGPDDVEQLLVWSLRRAVAWRDECPQIAQPFADACGDDAAEVFATLGVVIRMLAYAGRRRPRVAPPGSIGLTVCERQLLSIIAAAQAGDQACFDAHLRWIARADVRHELAMAIRAFAAALSAHRLILSLPARPPRPGMHGRLSLAISLMARRVPIEHAR
jgi:alkylhydroperoxidase/carboxymuconolactone decarboxylase family protein YurZ